MHIFTRVCVCFCAQTQTSDLEKFKSAVITGLLEVANKLSCPLTSTVFGKEFPAAFLANDGVAYVKHDWKGEIIESEEPLPLDVAKIPILSIRGYNSTVTNSDIEGHLLNGPTRFYNHPYTKQRLHISEAGVKTFDAVTDAGESVLGLIKGIRDTGIVSKEDLKNLEDMVPETVLYKWHGNNLASKDDVIKALQLKSGGNSGGNNDVVVTTPPPPMDLVDKWKKSFTTPITRSTMLPSGSWKNVLGQTDLEHIDPNLYRAHNRPLSTLTENHSEEHRALMDVVVGQENNGYSSEDM